MAHFDDPLDASRPDPYYNWPYYNWLMTEHPAMLGQPAAVTQPDAPAAATS